MFKKNSINEENLLEFYRFFNSEYIFQPYEIEILNSSKGNLLVHAKVPFHSFGGPYFYDKRGWEVPIDIKEHMFSWHFLVQGLFEKLDIPSKNYFNYDGIEETYITDIGEFKRVLSSKKGKTLIEKMTERERFFADILYTKVKGMQFFPQKDFNKQRGAIEKGDEFLISVFLNYWGLKGLDENAKNNFSTDCNGNFVLSERNIRKVVPLDF